MYKVFFIGNATSVLDPNSFDTETDPAFYAEYRTGFRFLIRPASTALKESKENIQRFKTWNSLIFFYFCGSFLPSWIRIQIPNPDPLTWLNPDPIRIQNIDANMLSESVLLNVDV